MLSLIKQLEPNYKCHEIKEVMGRSRRKVGGGGVFNWQQTYKCFVKSLYNTRLLFKIFIVDLSVSIFSMFNIN